MTKTQSLVRVQFVVFETAAAAAAAGYQASEWGTWQRCAGGPTSYGWIALEDGDDSHEPDSGAFCPSAGTCSHCRAVRTEAFEREYDARAPERAASDARRIAEWEEGCVRAGY